MKNLIQQFDRIRGVSQERGCFSWTSREYQDDILNYLIQHHQRGCGVVEVGCYKGGLSALIACLCHEFEWPFHTIDIDESAVVSTRNLLSELGYLDKTDIHHGTLASFVETTTLSDRPALIILDGDHRYEAVVEDLASVYRLNRLPFAAVFHDYSLRHPTSGEKVDQAVRDCLGNWPVRHIGARMDGSSKYPTKDHPAEDGHWWEVPGSEGAIVELPPELECSHTSKNASGRDLRSLFSRIRQLFTGPST
jgi:hypothetical protein